MKPFNVYRPPQRTIVTEVRQFLVDNTRKTGVNSFSVATKVTESTLEQKDITIGPDNPYTIKDVHNIVSIQCPHEIEMELVSFGSIPEPEVRTEQIFHDAEIEIGKADAGRFVSVTVKDLDIFTSAPLTIQAMNMRTGETEEVVLQRVTQGLYSGFLVTQNNVAQGEDFDQVMYCQENDILSFKYEEAYGASGHSQVVTAEQVVTLDFVPTSFEAPASVPFGKFINFRVKNPSTPHTQITNLRSGSTLQVTHAQMVPIEVGYVDSPTSFAADDGDVFQLVTVGKDIHGDPQSIVHEITVRSNVVPALDVQTQVNIVEPFTVTVTDPNMSDNPRLTLRNQVSGAVLYFPLTATFAYSGKYTAQFESFYQYGLPGQPVTVEYTAGGQTVTKQLELVAPPAPEIPVIVPTPDEELQSAPVRFRVNGQFMLNGSFAGTIKLMADKVTRITLIKA